MTLEQLGLRNGDIITVTKKTVIEEVKVEPIRDEINKCLTPKAHRIFSEWFDMYKDPEIGKMTHQSSVRFILGVTNEFTNAEYSRIKAILSTYAKKDPTG